MGVKDKGLTEKNTTNNYMKSALCLLARRPHDVWLEFLTKFTLYDVYIVIDEYTLDLTSYREKYPNITFVQIDNDTCKAAGFYNLTLTLKGPNKILAWDRALYYFCHKVAGSTEAAVDAAVAVAVDPEYANIWFIEDDVFFYGEETLHNLDLRYPASDLLTAAYHTYMIPRGWHWGKVSLPYDPPYYHCMACVTRASRELISRIHEYVRTHGKCAFLEAFFPTIAKKSSLRYDTPKELSKIVHRQRLGICDLDKIHLFHPVKNIDMHAEARAKQAV